MIAWPMGGRLSANHETVIGGGNPFSWTCLAGVRSPTFWGIDLVWDEEIVVANCSRNERGTASADMSRTREGGISINTYLR